MALRKHLEDLGKAEALHLHHEVEDIASLTAAETLVDLKPLVDIERGGFFVVERTQAGVVVGAAFLQAHRLADDTDDVDRRLDVLCEVHPLLS